MKLSALTIFDAMQKQKFMLLAAMTPQKKEFLMGRYHATEEQLAEVDAADPTPNGAYAEWIVQRWLRDAQFHLPEDALGPNGLKAALSKFNRDRNKAAWRGLVTPDFPTGLSNNIQEYSYQTLLSSVLAFKDPNEVSIPEVSAPIIYEGQGAILWKVPKDDWQSLWELGKAGKASWCTARPGDPSFAKHYITTGPIYVCFVDGKPYFQYMPGGRTANGGHENPQFMDRFNTAFMKTTMIDQRAYDILKAVPSEPDLVKVTEQFSPPNMDGAETLKYLSEVLSLDKDYWKRSPEFREKELLFVKSKYIHADPDELTALILKYPRTGELIKDFADENPHVKKLNEKLSTYPTMADFKKDFFDKGATNIVGVTGRGVFDDDQRAMMVNLPPLFDKIFALYRKETNFDATFAEMKSLAAAKDPKALEIARTLVGGIRDSFYGQSWRSDASGKGLNYAGADKAAGRFIDIIKSVVRPIIKGIYTNLETELSTYTPTNYMTLREKLNDIKGSIQHAFPSDENVNIIIREKETEIKKKVMANFYAEIPSDLIISDLMKKMKEMEVVAINLAGDLAQETVETGCNQILGPKLKQAIDKLVSENVDDPAKLTSELMALKTSFRTPEDPYIRGNYTTNAVTTAFAKEAEPIIQKRYIDLGTKGLSTEQLLSQGTQIQDEATVLGVKGINAHSEFINSFVIPQITREFNMIQEQQETLSNTDYLALLINAQYKLIQISTNGRVQETARTEFKRLAEEPIKEHLASLTKLKHVKDQIEAWDMEEVGWINALAEERMTEIREGRAARQVDRPGGAATRTRFAPKAEFEKWGQEVRAWEQTKRQQPQQLNPDGTTGPAPLPPKPKVSEKTEAFIMTSPSIEQSEVSEYYEFIDEVSPAYQAWIIDRNPSAAFVYLKNKAKTWPQLGEKLIFISGIGNTTLEAYRKFIYKDTVWPEYEASVLALSLANRNDGGNLEKMVNYSIEMKKGHWQPLDDKLKTLITGPNWTSIFTSHYFGNYWKDPIFRYIGATGRLADKDVEKILCGNADFAIEYLRKLIPADKISELLDKFNEKKEAGKRNIISVLLRELEKSHEL